jgi:flavin reductase (DIM6/NTAB) family NADH-FMN oxidoreductase RutF
LTDAVLKPSAQDATDLGADIPSALKLAMRRLASGVAVVTANGVDGPTGMAATSITSLSLDPPSLLVCVNRDASLHACLAEGSRLSVNLLADNQREIAAAFGGAVARELRFTVGQWTLDAHGTPQLDGAQSNLSCSVDRLIAYGTHTVVIGKVDSVRLGDISAPLIYQDGRYL